MSDDLALELEARLNREILVLDGAMGSFIQSLGFDEAAFRGERFVEHGHELRGNNDLLCLSQPEAIFEIHRQYLMAGADIVSTNSLSCRGHSSLNSRRTIVSASSCTVHLYGLRKGRAGFPAYALLRRYFTSV